MAEQKRSSRLRLPTWLQPRSQPTEKPTGRRPPTQTSTQAPPPPPALTPPESQPSPPSTERTKSLQSRVTPKPLSPPSRASAQPQDASQDTSPSRVAAESQSAAQPPSPSRATIQPQAETQQPSQANPQIQFPPTKLAPQPSTQTSSLPPPSPSLTATKAQSAPREAVTQPPLSSENLQPTTRPLPSFPPSTEPISSVSEEEPKPARSEPESQELQPKAETVSENVLNAQNQTQSQTTFQPNKVPADHSEASVRVTEPPQTFTTAEDIPVLAQKSDSSIVSSETKSLPESDGHQGQDKEGKEILQKDGSKEKIASVTEILSAAPGSEVATQMHPSIALDVEPKQLEKEEVTGKKETTSNSSSHGKEDQTVILNLKDKATVSESRHQPNISKGEKAPLQKEIRDDISKFLHGMATHPQKLPLGESQAIVVTLAGENRGASMQLLGPELAKREGTVHIRRGYKINPDESGTDGEMISEGRGSQDSKTGEDQEPKAYINSNVQGVNNSIMFNSSINKRDPGVQLALTHDLTEPIKPNRSMQSPETRKAEVIVTTAQKLTYEPIVRRRCLRGLFLEPSDSDPDNPEKPRRHGCQYACKGKSKDNEIDVL